MRSKRTLEHELFYPHLRVESGKSWFRLKRVGGVGFIRLSPDPFNMFSACARVYTSNWIASFAELALISVSRDLLHNVTPMYAQCPFSFPIFVATFSPYRPGLTFCPSANTIYYFINASLGTWSKGSFMHRLRLFPGVITLIMTSNTRDRIEFRCANC